MEWEVSVTKAAETEKGEQRRTRGKRLWGQMASYDKRVRILALVFVVAAIASMSFTQLAFWSIGTIDAKSVYLLLMLGPLIMGAFMFGPLLGGILGLYAGAVLFVHAVVFPSDYYEVYFMTPLNTFLLLTAIGAVAGALFSLATKRLPHGAARTAAIAAICVVLSFAASGLIQLNTIFAWGGLEYFDQTGKYLLNSPTGVVVQALIDAAGMILLCIISDAVLRSFAVEGSKRRLHLVFRSWMLIISFIVFMVVSALIFTIATLYSNDDAAKSMTNEVDYLINQLNKSENADYEGLLEGYTTELDGQVAITDENAIIRASDDKNLPAGESLLTWIGYEDYEATPDGANEFFRSIIEDNGGIAAIQATDREGAVIMEINVLATGAYDNGNSSKGYVAIIRPTAMIYAARFGIMASATLLAIVLIAAIALLASRLLKQVVVRRIDETNDSLEIITDGNLNERVRVRSSLEFASLSAGINTTVAALKGTIAEVEQRNAQDLATAKAIQESALPRDFPPFPDIDRFDIYASMKTAKEVGGDFYNFFLIDDTHLGFLIADVSGKGIPAALFMMTAKTQLQNYMESGLSVGEAVNAANHQLCIGNDAGMFVTAFICVLDFETGELSYVNAGHNPPLMHRGEAWEWIRNVSGMPLGLFDGLPYDEFSEQLQKDDVLYLYTDGVTEAMDVDGNLFGEDRLDAVLGEYAGMNPRSICVGIRRALAEFALNAEQSDDITMLCLKYGVPPEKKAYMVLPAVDTQLMHVCSFIHEELHRHSAPKSAYNPLDIAAEELFVNVCHYAYPDATPDNPGEVRIGFEYEANPPSLTVTISDDGIPYNPLAYPEATTVDQFDDVNDVPIGGLGILMAKQCVDDMTYEYVDGSNVLTFRKGW